MLSKNNPAPVSSLALIPKRQCSPEDPPNPQPSACVTLFIGIHLLRLQYSERARSEQTRGQTHIQMALYNTQILL